MVAIQKKHINSPIGGCRSKVVCNRYIAMAVALLYAVMMIVLLQRSNNNNNMVDNRKLPTITSTDASSSSNHQYYASIVKEIITKWNITTPNAAYLLEQQFYNNNECSVFVPSKSR